MNSSFAPKAVRTFLALFLAVSLGAPLARAEQLSAEEKARLKKLDSGTKVIDVSKYTEEQQAGYKLFSKKCTKCHSLARPINTAFVLPSEWERYIKRMLYKPDSKLSEEESKSIYRFLVYDSSIRKADSLRVHLARLGAEERSAAVTRIQALNPAFKLK